MNLAEVWCGLVAGVVAFLLFSEFAKKCIPALLRKRNSIPDAPSKSSSSLKLRSLPIFGNLFDLGSHPHRTLAELSPVYGDVMELQLGRWKAVVLNGSDACREALIQHGRSTASRPSFESYLHYSHGRSLSFQPFNAAWQIQRKAASRTIAKLLGSGIVSRLARRQSDKLMSLWSAKALRGEEFDPSEDVAKAVGGFVYSFCYGEEELLEDNEEFADILLRPNPGTDMLAMGNNIDLVPRFLRFVHSGRQRSHVHRMNEFVRLNALMRATVVRNVERRSLAMDGNDAGVGGGEFQSVMHGMMLEADKLFGDGEEEEVHVDGSDSFEGTTFHRDCLLNLPSEFLSAGSETSTAVLLWLIRFVAARPDVQERIFSELEEHARRKDGGDVFVDGADRAHLPFTEASFLESLRLMAVVPFGLAHLTTEDVRLGGRDVPGNTLLLPNLWSAGRDPRKWEEPDEFRPERHLSRCPYTMTSNNSNCNTVDSINNNVNGSNNSGDHFTENGRAPAREASRLESFFPFGLGRRRCVGEQVGRTLNFALFANLMHRFKIQLVTDGGIDDNSGGHARVGSKLGNAFRRLTGSFLEVSPKTPAASEDVLESYGDVMKPRAYKILLKTRPQYNGFKPINGPNQ